MNGTALDEVIQAARASHHDLRTTPQCTELLPTGCTTVAACRADAGRPAEFVGLNLDLASKLASWCEHAEQGWPHPCLHDTKKPWKEEGKRFAASRLGDADEVTSSNCYRPCVGLDWGGRGETSALQTLQQLRREKLRCGLETGDSGRHLVTTRPKDAHLRHSIVFFLSGPQRLSLVFGDCASRVLLPPTEAVTFTFEAHLKAAKAANSATAQAVAAIHAVLGAETCGAVGIARPSAQAATVGCETATGKTSGTSAVGHWRPAAGHVSVAGLAVVAIVIAPLHLSVLLAKPLVSLHGTSAVPGHVHCGAAPSLPATLASMGGSTNVTWGPKGP
mmetsp:Transcript_41357/g.95813  ORF Transcript_41357/g.95813 Transcript_41357/m.95813 type:complete len:333 (-) Transcript_41357:24-1022(-)